MIGIQVGAPDVQGVLDYLKSARVVFGKTDVKAVPCCTDDYFGFIDSVRDCYKTPLLRAE
jgi:hypothetical protein